MKTFISFIIILATLLILYGMMVAFPNSKSFNNWDFVAPYKQEQTGATAIGGNINGTIIAWDGDVSWYQHNPTKTAVFKKDGTKKWFVNGKPSSKEEFMTSN